MIYKAQNREIDLEKITRLYPAATVNASGERAQVSLEWAQMKADVITIESYVLIFDIDPLEEEPKNRIELIFESKEELLEAINDVAQYL
ncbi:MAG: hypothetical protein U9R50_04200 [Campylobacterota bacterium]|nr:hypothetical protein [Campylobacterota bacterium]